MQKQILYTPLLYRTQVTTHNACTLLGSKDAESDMWPPRRLVVSVASQKSQPSQEAQDQPFLYCIYCSVMA